MSQFSISSRECGPATVIELRGFLDAHTAPELETTFETLISKGVFRIIVSFRELAYISSAGLGVFMAFIEEVRSNGGDIKLVSMSPKVYNVFDLLGFPMLYEIYDEEDQAVARFRDSTEPTV